MQAMDILLYLKTQIEQGHALFEKDVVVRIAGRDYMIRRIDASTSHIVLEAGEAVLHEDSLPGDPPARPGGPEGEGVEPPPPSRKKTGRER